MLGLLALTGIVAALTLYLGYQAGYRDGAQIGRDQYNRLAGAVNDAIVALPIGDLARAIGNCGSYDKIGAILAAKIDQDTKRIGDLKARRMEFTLPS